MFLKNKTDDYVNWEALGTEEEGDILQHLSELTTWKRGERQRFVQASSGMLYQTLLC